MIRLFVSYSGIDSDGNECTNDTFVDVPTIPRDKDAINAIKKDILNQEALVGFNMIGCAILHFQQV